MRKIIFILSLIIFSCNSKPVETETTETLAIDSTLSTLKVEPEITIKKDEKKIKLLSPLFRVKKDEFEHTEWIIPKSAPTYRNYKTLHCYFAVSDSKPSNLRMSFSYVSDDWLFIRNAKFLVDGEVFDYFPEEVKKDNGDGEIWEWWDQSVSYSDMSLLKKIANSKTAKVKLQGDQYYDIVVITEKQKKSLKNTLEYYEALGGTFY